MFFLNNIFFILVFFSMACGKINKIDTSSAHWYIGTLGGISFKNNVCARQEGAVYRYTGQFFPCQETPTDENYTFYVNVTGKHAIKVGGMTGIRIGLYQNYLDFNTYNKWLINPSFDVEGIYLGSKISGMLHNPILEPAVKRDDGMVIPSHSIAANKHQFYNTYNLGSGLILFNTIFNIRHSIKQSIMPYIGIGIGFSSNTLYKGSSAQIKPCHEDVNHFNSDKKSTCSKPCIQGRFGISSNKTDSFSVFIEYRYLNIAPTSYIFGNTYYPGYHADTSKWNVSFKSMSFQVLALGFNYAFQ